jgi:hypothetical protein
MSQQWVSKFETLPHRGNVIVKRKFDVWNIVAKDLEKPFAVLADHYFHDYMTYDYMHTPNRKRGKLGK